MGENTSKDDVNEQSTVNRRTVLAGALSGTGYLAFGAGAASARKGPPDHAGNPQKECDCDGVSGKYEFDGEGCQFDFSEGEDLVSITYDPDKPKYNKEGERCEPIAIDYEADYFYGVTKVCAFGGTDNDVDNEPTGTYESDLTNPGGQEAAISNVTFCLGERADAYQVDLIYGDTIIDDPCNADETYNQQGRLLQARWGYLTNLGGRLETFQFDQKPEAYEDCWDVPFTDISSDDAIDQNIQFNVDDEIATVRINTDRLDGCTVDDFSLVSYKSINDGDDEEPPRFENCAKQSEFDRDIGGNNHGEFEVDIPVSLVDD